MKFFYPFILLCQLLAVNLLLLKQVQAAEVLHQDIQTSRDTRYISFHNSDEPFMFKGSVGGEHTSIYQLLGFAGQVYHITFISIEGDSSANIYGEGFEKLRAKHKNATLTQLEITADQVFVTVDLSALSYGEYKLIIEKKSR